MDYYFDIIFKPDAEMPLNRVMNAVYTKLHKALCDISTTSVGVSFPEYAVTLGKVLRIHGSETELKNLQNLKWIGGMAGYCHLIQIKPVPEETKFRTVFRKQSTMSQSKLKRLITRGSIPEHDIKRYKIKIFSKGLDNPYVELVSGSNGQKHRRYIEFGVLLDQPVAGIFDQFGLSKTATIPWF